LERKVGRNDLILPIYFLTSPTFDTQSGEFATALFQHQYRDWRDVRNIPMGSPRVRRKLDELAGDLCAAINREAGGLGTSIAERASASPVVAPPRTASDSAVPVAERRPGDRTFDEALRLESVGRFKEAADAYKVAANQGNLDAITNLGRMYRIGRGVQKSYIEAARYFNLAAGQGNAIAQASLARLYTEGWGVPQSDADAVRLYRLAADQSNAIAQFNLGDCYERGRGVQKSRTDAITWYRAAARQEMELAQRALRRLGESW
jgi:TPR repeat protein